MSESIPTLAGNKISAISDSSECLKVSILHPCIIHAIIVTWELMICIVCMPEAKNIRQIRTDM